MSYFIDLFNFLDKNKICYEREDNIVRLSKSNYSLYLVNPLSSNNNNEQFKNFRSREKKLNDHFLVYIWFDLWDLKQDVILSKINHLCGLSIRIHARKTKLISISKSEAHSFLNNNHLNIPVTGFKRLALTYNGKIVAVATFAKRRKFRDNTYSAELLQFSTIRTLHINGGLSKLIKHFVQQHPIDSLMTYIDLDWSNGERFSTVNFIITKTKHAVYFNLNNSTKKREPSRIKSNIFSLGSLKAIQLQKK